MKVLITGAGGFVGRTLAARLLAEPAALGPPLSQLVLADHTLRPAANGATLVLEGDLAQASTIATLAAQRPDVVFHLASVPGGLAEREQALGRRVNLDATLALLEALAAAPGQKPPVVVFASTVAVYGSALPPVVTAATPLCPAITYGAHKLMGEIALADFTRRGLLDGRSLRLPGIVARPRGPSGLASAFMSELFHALAAGEPFACPVSAQATAWWMSVGCCASNLVHAARLPAHGLDPQRSWQLPVLHASMAQVVDALARCTQQPPQVNYQPDAALEAVFGRYPPLDAAPARALGFSDDGSLDALVARALEPAA